MTKLHAKQFGAKFS